MAARKRDDMRPQSPGAAQDSQSLHWHIAITGIARGPYTLRQMLAFRGADRLAPDTFVHCEGWAEWRRVGEVPELNVSANSSRARVPLLTRPTAAGASRASRDDVASQRPLGAPPPLPVAMGYDPFAVPELEDDPPPRSGTSAHARSSFDAFSTTSWDLDAMPPLEALAASSRVRKRGPAQRTVAATGKTAGRRASGSRPAAPRVADPARSWRAAIAERWQGAWSVCTRGAQSVRQRMRIPDGVRRAWDGTSSRVQAVERRVRAPQGMPRILDLAKQRLQTALAREAIVGLGRRIWARALRDTRALVQRTRGLGERMRALAGEHQAWRRELRRIAALRFAGARVGTLATILLAGLFAGAASFVGANVLHGPGSRFAHSTPRRTPASAHPDSPPLACMPVASRPVTSQADAPVTAMFALQAAEVRESTVQPSARRPLRSTRSGVGHSRRRHGAVSASGKGASQVASASGKGSSQAASLARR